MFTNCVKVYELCVFHETLKGDLAFRLFEIATPAFVVWAIFGSSEGMIHTHLRRRPGEVSRIFPKDSSRAHTIPYMEKAMIIVWCTEMVSQQKLGDSIDSDQNCHIAIHTHTHTHTYVYIHTYKHTYTHIHTYTHYWL